VRLTLDGFNDGSKLPSRSRFFPCLESNRKPSAPNRKRVSMPTGSYVRTQEKEGRDDAIHLLSRASWCRSQTRLEEMVSTSWSSSYAGGNVGMNVGEEGERKEEGKSRFAFVRIPLKTFLRLFYSQQSSDLLVQWPSEKFSHIETVDDACDSWIH
jgi:hypothetical protein